MATEKLSTVEILALARRQGAFGDEGGSSGAASSAESAPDPPATEEPRSGSKSAPPTPPSATADILAAARGQGGASTPTEPDAEKSKPAAAKTPPASAPKSTADILAAARAQAKPAGKAETAPATAPPAVAKTVTAAGEHPSVQEMVRAMHQDAPAAPSAAPAASPSPAVQSALPGKPSLPKKPGKPPLPRKVDQDAVSRRSALSTALVAGLAILLTPFAFGWALMAVIGGLWSLLTARFMMPNMVVELPSKFKVGPPSDFPPGAVSEKFKASRGVWIVNTDAYNGEESIYVLYSVCTHLGCTPNWLEGEQKFKCPCHGSGFYITGINFEGPAPRPLERAGIQMAEDGSLEVDKSVKFQEELGQWQDGKSFFQA